MDKNKYYSELKKFLQKAVDAVNYDDPDVTLLAACISKDNITDSAMGDPCSLLAAIKEAVARNLRMLSATEIRDLYHKYLPILDITIKHAEDRWERQFDDDEEFCQHKTDSEYGAYVDISLLKKLLETNGYSFDNE